MPLVIDRYAGGWCNHGRIHVHVHLGVRVLLKRASSWHRHRKNFDGDKETTARNAKLFSGKTPGAWEIRLPRQISGYFSMPIILGKIIHFLKHCYAKEYVCIQKQKIRK